MSRDSEKQNLPLVDEMMCSGRPRVFGDVQRRDEKIVDSSVVSLVLLDVRGQPDMAFEINCNH